MGKLDEADRALDEAAADANDRRRQVVLALARRRNDEKRGDTARAARRLDEALAKSAGRPAARARPAPPSTSGGATGSARSAAPRRCSPRQPRNVEALNFAGFVAVDHATATTDLGRALKRVQAAVALSPGSGGIVDSLGWAYFRSGDLAARRRVPRTGRRASSPATPRSWATWAISTPGASERERALATYRRALEAASRAIGWPASSAIESGRSKRRAPPGDETR